MALTETEVITLEVNEDGFIHLKTTTTIFKDGVKIGRNNHRKVLNPEDGDYSEKLATASESIIGQLAVQQQATINAMQDTIDALVAQGASM